MKQFTRLHRPIWNALSLLESRLCSVPSANGIYNIALEIAKVFLLKQRSYFPLPSYNETCSKRRFCAALVLLRHNFECMPCTSLALLRWDRLDWRISACVFAVPWPCNLLFLLSICQTHPRALCYQQSPVLDFYGRQPESLFFKVLAERASAAQLQRPLM